MAIQKSNLAVQVCNTYKGANGQYVFYAECKPRPFKETDPALSYGRTSVVAFNLFDTKNSKGVVAYLNPGDPGYLFAKVNALMKDIPLPEYATYKLVTYPYTGLTALETIKKAVASGKDEEKLKVRETARNCANKKDAEMLAAALIAYANKAMFEPVVTILDETKTPDVSKVDANGNTEVRLLKLNYDYIKKTYNLTVSNFKAPPIKGSLVGAAFSKKTDELRLSMTFSEYEFFEIVDEIYHAKEMYSRATEGRRIRYAEENAWHPEAK